LLKVSANIIQTICEQTTEEFGVFAAAMTPGDKKKVAPKLLEWAKILTGEPDGNNHATILQIKRLEKA